MCCAIRVSILFDCPIYAYLNPFSSYLVIMYIPLFSLNSGKCSLNFSLFSACFIIICLYIIFRLPYRYMYQFRYRYHRPFRQVLQILIIRTRYFYTPSFFSHSSYPLSSYFYPFVFYCTPFYPFCQYVWGGGVTCRFEIFEK